MFNILVTGSNGQMGSELKVLSSSKDNYSFTFVDRQMLDLSNLTDLRKYFELNKFDVIINCAAYTAVDKAETEIEIANTVNHIGVAELAKVAKEKNITLIHLSTDYVFDGKNQRPYLETDSTNPINIYGKTKRDGEEAILTIAPKNSIIIRTSWLYSSFGNNFVKTILNLAKKGEGLKVIFDQVGSPTYARDLASTILEIIPKIKNEKPEIYNYSNDGETNWFEFAQAILNFSNLSCKVEPIRTDQYVTRAKRPQYSLLNKEKIKKDFGVIISPWEKSLERSLRDWQS